MEYIKLFWEHDLADEPTSILYEVNTENERLAERSIDIFQDGRTENIPDLYADVIEITSIPTVEEFNSDTYGEEFHASRACLKNAFRQMCVTVCGRFAPNEGRIAGYVT